jgi:hypothetical protein
MMKTYSMNELDVENADLTLLQNGKLVAAFNIGSDRIIRLV